MSIPILLENVRHTCPSCNKAINSAMVLGNTKVIWCKCGEISVSYPTYSEEYGAMTVTQKVFDLGE